LKFAKDRKRWLHWLFEARKRCGLCVLNYIITSNHIYLLVRDRGQGTIKNSMQLVAGRNAQEYKARNNLIYQFMGVHKLSLKFILACP